MCSQPGPPAAGDRNTVDRLRTCHGATRNGVAPGPVLVHRQLRADHDGDGFPRPRGRAWPRIWRAWPSCSVCVSAPSSWRSTPTRARRMGLPQMIQSRAQFGSAGRSSRSPPCVFVYVGFNVFNVVLATQGAADRPARRALVLVPVADRSRGRVGRGRLRPAALGAALADLSCHGGVRRLHDRRAVTPGRALGDPGHRCCLDRLPHHVLRRGRLPDQLRGLRVRLLPLSAEGRAQHAR